MPELTQCEGDALRGDLAIHDGSHDLGSVFLTQGFDGIGQDWRDWRHHSTASTENMRTVVVGSS